MTPIVTCISRPTAVRPSNFPPSTSRFNGCISSEALNTYNHAFGGDWGGRNTGFHHNLFACNTGRNPSVAMTYDFNFVNNVLFNWRHRTIDGGGEKSLYNIINNYYKPGPAVEPRPGARIASLNHPPRRRSKTRRRSLGKAYVAGNIVEGNQKVTADNWAGGVQFAARRFEGDPDDHHQRKRERNGRAGARGQTVPDAADDDDLGEGSYECGFGKCRRDVAATAMPWISASSRQSGREKSGAKARNSRRRR